MATSTRTSIDRVRGRLLTFGPAKGLTAVPCIWRLWLAKVNVLLACGFVAFAVLVGCAYHARRNERLRIGLRLSFSPAFLQCRPVCLVCANAKSGL
jgi:hypothetical protein